MLSKMFPITSIRFLTQGRRCSIFFGARFFSGVPVGPAGRGAALLGRLAKNVEPPKTAIIAGGKSDAVLKEACGDVEEEVVEMEEMFVATTVGREWGGPMRGGRYKEPTRFGDWEQKGRCTDF